MVKNKQEKTIVALPKKVGHESAASVKKREKQPDRMIGENPRLTHFFSRNCTSHLVEKKRNRYRSTKTGFLSILRPCFFFWHIPGNGLKSSHLSELNNWWKKREEKKEQEKKELRVVCVFVPTFASSTSQTSLRHFSPLEEKARSFGPTHGVVTSGHSTVTRGLVFSRKLTDFHASLGSFFSNPRTNIQILIKSLKRETHLRQGLRNGHYFH